MANIEKCAFISGSYQERDQIRQSVEIIRDVLNSRGYSGISQLFDPPNTDTRELMKNSFAGIDGCALLILEGSFKRIGIGIEAGYGKAKGKPVVYIRKEGSDISTTLQGIADFEITYQTFDDLRQQFSLFLDSFPQIIVNEDKG